MALSSADDNVRVRAVLRHYTRHSCATPCTPCDPSVVTPASRRCILHNDNTSTTTTKLFISTIITSQTIFAVLARFAPRVRQARLTDESAAPGAHQVGLPVSLLVAARNAKVGGLCNKSEKTAPLLDGAERHATGADD